MSTYHIKTKVVCSFAYLDWFYLFFLKGCVPPFHLHNGQCLQNCPPGFYSLSTHCLSCHEHCRECEGPEDDDCIACPETSYALFRGRCFEYCPDGTYFEEESSSCRGIPFSVQLVIQIQKVHLIQTLQSNDI